MVIKRATFIKYIHWDSDASDTDSESKLPLRRCNNLTFLVSVLQALSFREIYGRLPQNAVRTAFTTYVVLPVYQLESATDESSPEELSSEESSDTDF